jgi:Fungal N-terminal domain of STAND proteins
VLPVGIPFWLAEPPLALTGFLPLTDPPFLPYSTLSRLIQPTLSCGHDQEMARNVPLGELVLSSLQSQDLLVTVILALSTHNDFTPLLEQLSAFRGFLTILQQVPTNKETDFTNIKDLLQRTSKFCTTIRGDLQKKFQSGSTDWSSLNCLGDDVNSYTSKLRLYTSALGVGAIDAAG